MPSRRYTILLSDASSGIERRITIAVLPVTAVACAVITLPVLIGFGAAWKARTDASGLYAANQALETENTNFRAATEELVGQIESLQTAIADLGARSALDPNLSRAMNKLPALVKARAMGGGSAAERSPSGSGQDLAQTLSALAGPEDTFGLLRSLLEGLESRLTAVRRTVDKRNALAAATPSLWPASGWLTSTMGTRHDPITGSEDFHAGLDIAGDKGQPVYATAAGTVGQASYQGAYGNVILLDHGFGLQTRYGHLSEFKVKIGDKVKRGDIIGRVGATGRATGYHLHYEVLANGKLLNPLQLLTQRPRDR